MKDGELRHKAFTQQQADLNKYVHKTTYRVSVQYSIVLRTGS